MIGLSVSNCIRDIALGKHAIYEVDKIVAGTCARDESDWMQVVGDYKKYAWRSSLPDECEKILWQLLAQDKIEQPRLENPFHMPNIAAGHWVEDESQIFWWHI